MRENQNAQLVWLYPSNLVDYLRLILLGAALYCRNDAGFFVGLITVSVLLDLVDGWLARRLGQASPFGEVLDFGVDLATHTILWVASGFPFAPVLILLEWAAGVSVMWFSRSHPDHWKAALMLAHPFLGRYFANRQRNLLAGWAVVSHFGFRIAWHLGYGDTWVSDLTLPGIIVFEIVTVYMVWLPVRMRSRS